MGRKRKNRKSLKKPSRKRLKTDDSCNWRPWSDLPEDLLDMISKRLGMVDYLAFGGVCKRWRSLVEECKRNFMDSQPPHIVIISTHAKKTCSLKNMADGKRFKTMLPHFAGKYCSASSCGYLVMQGRNDVWFVNPFTRHELHFPGLPNFADHIILTSIAAPSPDVISVAVFRSYAFLKFCRSKDTNWTVYSYANQPWIIVDVAVFKGKLYAVTNDARVGVFNLSCLVSFTFLEVKSIPTLSPFLLLATSDEQLLMVDFRGSEQLRVYELDFTRMQWVKIKSLGDNALFVSDMKFCTINNPARWGGRSNCVYHVGCVLNLCSMYSLEGKLLDRFTIIGKELVALFVKPFLWYFPHQLYRMDSLVDDYQAP
ncbi:probable F-box protein At4g22060 [Malania oleifera]|uniref:probable F-box protein At4g22060 n=1 Tax=Malania oleifera TaxID=397392 RepID=UPI0025AE27FB|nr:probable F-box protein At4g22060 [Malania oleifera]